MVERHLRRRVKRGKEDPERVNEKRGFSMISPPTQPVIWCHAVGVGEALALVGFTALLSNQAPNHKILITTSSRNAADVLERNIDERAIHQYLPLDVPPYVERFLDHWCPELVVWAERDIWPRLMVETNLRGIPQVIINGRMNDRSLRQKLRAKRLFKACYERCAFIDVQDQNSAGNFQKIASNADVSVSGSMKAYAPPLTDHENARMAWQDALRPSEIWLAASIHKDEFENIIKTQTLLKDKGWKAVFAPRNPSDVEALAAQIRAKGWTFSLASEGKPGPTDIVIEDRLGFMGLWYRLANCAFIGGSWDHTGGHNPYEAARLACPFFTGPNVENFKDDFEFFWEAGIPPAVDGPAALQKAIEGEKLKMLSQHVLKLSNQGETAVKALAIRSAALLHQAE